MAWAGTLEYRQLKNGLHAKWTDFDADAEIGSTLDLFAQDAGFMPSYFVFKVERTAGSTDVISFKIEGSEDGTDWDTIATMTAHDETVTFTVDYTATVAPMNQYRKFKITCTTVGSGNTLDMHAIFWW